MVSHIYSTFSYLCKNYVQKNPENYLFLTVLFGRCLGCIIPSSGVAAARIQIDVADSLIVETRGLTLAASKKANGDNTDVSYAFTPEFCIQGDSGRVTITYGAHF
jgi:hypothetical protein